MTVTQKKSFHFLKLETKYQAQITEQKLYEIEELLY
jgi:hypothetical protein